MKVLYFTSTGNSLWVARQFTDTPQSIIHLMRSGTYEISDDEAIGIITPDHFSNVPKPVRAFLEKEPSKHHTYSASSLMVVM